mgnify:FL=1
MYKRQRFSVWNPNNAVVSFDMCEPLSHRVSDLGWNMQLHMSARQLMEQEEIVSRLPGKVVIDHMGRLDPEKGIDPVRRRHQPREDDPGWLL